ncbi:MAG: helix-hairpin-helix domain-containing protein [Solirubrobacteraceae bacterium]
MADLTRLQLALCVIGVVLAAALGLRQLGSGTGDSRAASAPQAAAAIQVDEGGAEGGVIVHVAGAVRQPGVYKLRASARVDDAVARAGGATRRADLGGLNLAAKLEDGRQVLVPQRVAAGAAVPPAAATAAPAEGQPLNLNTATLEQLDLLSGVGPTTAQKILDAREERGGGFGSVEELGEIPGIGEKRLASLREEATL